MSVSGLDEFNSRIGRIQAGGAFTRATIYIGLEDTFQRDLTRQVAAVPRMHLRETLSAGLAHVWAFLFGYGAFVLMLFLRCLMGGRAEDGLLVLGLDIIGAALASVALAQVLKLNSPLHRALQLIGIALSVLTMHNLVHLAPDAFSWAFSPVWVGQVMQSTPAQSLVLGDFVLRF
jgi:hypothetical protein